MLASAIPTVASGPLQLSFAHLAWWKALHTKRDECHFCFETSPNTKQRKKGGATWCIISPPSEKKWVETPPCPPPNCDHGCRRSQGGEALLKFFHPPWKNVLDIFKNLGPSQTTFLPSGVPSWLRDNFSPLWCPKLVTGLVLIKMQTERS